MCSRKCPVDNSVEVYGQLFVQVWSCGEMSCQRQKCGSHGVLGGREARCDCHGLGSLQKCRLLAFSALLPADQCFLGVSDASKEEKHLWRVKQVDIVGSDTLDCV